MLRPGGSCTWSIETRRFHRATCACMGLGLHTAVCCTVDDGSGSGLKVARSNDYFRGN
jgi:hypothetical protein